MAAGARLEIRMQPEDKALIERAAELSNLSVTSFVTGILMVRAKEIVEGPASIKVICPRPIGGWSFPLPEDWDAPLDDLAECR
jgi:hypothetical protein